MKKYILLTLTTLFLLVLGLNQAHAVEYDFLGGRPSNPDPEVPNSSSWFIYDLDKGDSKQDSLTVINNLPDETTVIVYAADSVRSSNGGFALKQYVDPREEIGSWIRFYPDPVPEFLNDIFAQAKDITSFCKLDLEAQFTNTQLKEFEDWCDGKEEVEIVIPAKKQRDVSFTFTVPEDADVGEYTGGILIQKKETSEATVGDLQGVVLTTRVGIRIYQTVPGDIKKELKIKTFNVKKSEKKLQIADLFKFNNGESYDISTEIENLGNVSVDFTETIIIKNETTDSEPEIISNRNFQVLRGDSFTSTFNWKKTEFGKHSFSTQIEYEDIKGEKIGQESYVATKWVLPYYQAAVALLFICIILLVLILRKLKHMKLYGGDNWVPYVIKSNETIKTIEKKFNVKWETFVKTNKIKPPYDLVEGKTVYVPRVKTKK